MPREGSELTKGPLNPPRPQTVPDQREAQRGESRSRQSLERTGPERRPPSELREDQRVSDQRDPPIQSSEKTRPARRSRSELREYQTSETSPSRSSERTGPVRPPPVRAQRGPDQ